MKVGEAVTFALEGGVGSLQELKKLGTGRGTGEKESEQGNRGTAGPKAQEGKFIQVLRYVIFIFLFFLGILAWVTVNFLTGNTSSVYLGP